MKDVNLAPYNADRTGVADATAAINACLSAGFSAYLPNGVYKITDTINLPSTLSIIGDGSGVSLILNYAANKPTISFNHSGFVGGAWNHLTGISMDRVGVTPAAATGNAT